LRVAFAGTPEFASPALEAIVAAGHEVSLVLTQPDRPAGRGMRLAESHVATTAARLGLRISKPASLKAEAVLPELREAAPDVMVVAAYGLLLPRAVLGVPKHGCINIHASLLPRWRGAAPIHRALLAGDDMTGVCIMRMEEGLDTGPVLLERRVEIGPRDTTGILTDRLARLGAEAVVESLRRLDALEPRPQDHSRATYAAKVGKHEATIDWKLAAEQIDRQVRAFNPAPGAEGEVGGIRFKIWEAEPLPAPDAQPGVPVQLRPGELVIGCGIGSLQVLTVQRPGGRRMSAGEFLRGSPWAKPTVAM
jgi:methionyl-tRNA formyltransferase